MWIVTIYAASIDIVGAVHRLWFWILGDLVVVARATKLRRLLG